MNKIQLCTILGVCGLLLPLCAVAQEKVPYLLTVEEMFRLADENSKSIQVYETGASQAKEAVKVAKNAQLPTIDLSASVSYLGNGRVTDRDFTHWVKASNPHFNNSFAIEASQVVYAGGAVQGGIDIAKLQEKIARLAKEGNQQDVRFMLSGYYLELYKLYNQREVYLKNIELTNQVIANIQAKQTQGLALNNDVTRYELQLKNLELALTQINNSCIILNHDLVTTLGLPENTLIKPDTNLLEKQIPLTNEKEWQENALYNPTLQQAELGIALSLKQEKITRSEWLPKVAIVASGSMNGPITIEIPTIDKNYGFWYAGVGVKYNLASLYTTNKKQRMNKLATRQARENYALALEHTETAVQAAHIRFQESFVQFNTQKKSVELASQNYDVINNRYINDLALLTDMLDASNMKLSAELELVNMQINIVYSYYKLQYTTGTLK